ncbi:MAG: ATP-binding protein [Bacteroidales bacterium]|nr:ATP-binding protein [Bacteroidales bacterium]
MEYRRPQYDTMMARISEPRRQIQVLVGPRQVGKSTLMEQVVENLSIPFTLVSADDVINADTDWLSLQWESARAKMKVNAQNEHLLIIDEVQKVENWSEAVKGEWDRDKREKRNLKVVLLGSSRVLIRKGLTESLAGRYELIRMGHWTYPEMRDAFGVSLDQYVYFGGYPGAAHLIQEEPRWQAYIRDSLIEAALAKDVFQTATIYKPALLRQLFELGCIYSGEMLSLNKMLGQLNDAGNVTTLASYLELLEQCNLLGGLKKFYRDEARKYTSIPKYQVFNNALRNAYLRKSFDGQRLDPVEWGRQVESAVGAHLINQCDEAGCQLRYWREKDLEVNFVIERQGECVAIEVKSRRRGMNSGLPEFKKRYSPRQSFVVGTGGLSLEDFFDTKINDLF